MKRISLLLIIFTTFSQALFALPPEKGTNSEIETVIPAEVGTKLKMMGCKLPPIKEGMYASGEFAAEGQKDWVVLCLKGGGNYSIAMIWGGPVHCPEIKESFPRMAIHALTVDQVMRMPEGMIPKLADRVEHDFLIGIGNNEKRWYCENGKWNSDIATDP